MGVFDYFPFMYFFNYLMGYQHFALSGLRTCLVIQNQDPTPEYLLDCKIGISPVECSHNLSAVRLETTQVCFSVHFSFCHQGSALNFRLILSMITDAT